MEDIKVWAHFPLSYLKINPLHYSKVVLPKFTLVMSVDKFLLLPFIHSKKKIQQIFTVCSLCVRNFIGCGACRG